jgi:hypothetical protein
MVASCRLSGGDVESRESVTSTRAHTLTQIKKKKGFCTCYQSCGRNEEGRYTGQMKRLVNASKYFVLLIIKPKDNVEKEAFQGCDANLKSDLYEVINQYDEMFQEPKGLPPKRGIQHEIQLQQDCPLPNIGMYRMSVMENAEIKKQIQELLDKGLSCQAHRHVDNQLF